MTPPTQWALDPARGIKPLDFGGAGVTGSVDADGRLIALNTYHERYGCVTLTVADPFPETERYNPAVVRAYRRSLVGLTGFGPHFDRPVIRRDAYLLEHAVPHIVLTFEDGTQAEMTVFAIPNGAVQIWRCPHAPRWQGRLSLQRCAYTQLTEGGPVEMPPVRSSVQVEQGVLTLENSALNMTAAIAGLHAPEGRLSFDREGPVELDLPGQVGTAILVYAFAPTPAAAREKALGVSEREAFDGLQRELNRWYALAGKLDRLPARGAVYGRMLAIPVGDTCCILTDHMLLPLSWNRDAYYVARALLDHEPDLVRRHILWMFEVAERPAGYWGRCYLANGRIKDKAYQLDQQLFPLLELADYVLNTGNRDLWDRLRPAMARVVDDLLSRKHADAYLFPTDETPADDPLALPYHLSGHILLWRTFSRLGEIEPREEWAALARGAREAVSRQFTVEADGVRLYAYAIDGTGRFHLYHDANDLPLALAPLWGFVAADDPVWRATVDFAFSARNVGGFYEGRLGSIHTRAAWPLGDVQDALIARALGDPDRERRALDFLARAAQWDGALPEAYDVQTGEVVSRHWFAWPNAALTCFLSGAF